MHMNKWMDASYAPAHRAQLLLNEMSNEEKLWQLSADMIYSVEEDYDQRSESAKRIDSDGVSNIEKAGWLKYSAVLLLNIG